MASDDSQEAWYLKSNFPVLFPTHPALGLAQDDLEKFLQSDIKEHRDDVDRTVLVDPADREDSATVVSTTADLRDATKEMTLNDNSTTGVPEESGSQPKTGEKPQHPFIQGLLSHDPATARQPDPVQMENKMLTENADIAYRSTTSSHLDLFAELEEVVSGPRLLELLNAAWKDDPMMTLKIIFNARSIHLGKASRLSFYRCAGWLAQYHPLTLVANLRWLSRPVVQKKVEKKNDDDDDDMVLVEAEKDEDDITHFDIKNGVSHGYWKDLLNILTLSVNGKLNLLANPRDILNVEREGKKERSRGKAGSKDAEKVDTEIKIEEAGETEQESAKAKRHSLQASRHATAVAAFETDPVHRALHLTVARLFAEQLRSDLTLLHGDDNKAKKRISLCGKWAPSPGHYFHDKHTFVASSISELLHPMTADGEGQDREQYLRHAREAYRKDLSALRAHLGIVERKLTNKEFDKIKYDRVPSVAMSKYSSVFARKDMEHFEPYLAKVAEGKVQISGATLLPSTLIKAVREYRVPYAKPGAVKSVTKAKIAELNAQVVDGQWKTLVQRIKDSGTLENSIAVCDASGSMMSPRFPDGTCPMDSAIGLSLLLAEVTAPPFGGTFITFSSTPEVQTVDMSLSLREKYAKLSQAAWGMNTDFVAVFENLILPMALKNKLKQEDMVKRVFVFSDMQFDTAQRGYNFGRQQQSTPQVWSTSFERIQKKFADAGYEIPELVFWNLAGGRAGYHGGGHGDPVAPKPVTSQEPGTAIVSGYSQGMLKVFLDNGSFEAEAEDEGEDEEVVVEKTGDGEEEVKAESPSKRRKIDPLATVKKAVGHEAYQMLRVVD